MHFYLPLSPLSVIIMSRYVIVSKIRVAFYFHNYIDQWKFPRATDRLAQTWIHSLITYLQYALWKINWRKLHKTYIVLHDVGTIKMTLRRCQLIQLVCSFCNICSPLFPADILALINIKQSVRGRGHRRVFDQLALPNQCFTFFIIASCILILELLLSSLIAFSLVVALQLHSLFFRTRQTTHGLEWTWDGV